MWWLLLLSILLIIYLIQKSVFPYSNETLGWKYRNKFKLNLLDINRLNNLSAILQNSFRFDFCIEATIKLYLDTIRALPERRKRNKRFNQSLMLYCIYAIKQKYNYQLPTTELTDEIIGILDQAEISAVERHINYIRPLFQEEEKILFTSDKQRWKRVYEQIILKFDQNNPLECYEKIDQLATINRKIRITNARNIYYKGYLFMADKDRLASLKLYLKYLSIKSLSGTFEYKAISKRNMKLLFTDKNQKERFNQICTELENKNDLDKALESVTALFTVKRKKIALNVNAIQDANVKQNELARLLSNYLVDEDQGSTGLSNQEQLINEEKDLMEKAGKELLDLFISDTYCLNQQEVHTFAREKGLFEDQFIQNINERYYDILDDLLIEADGEMYILNKAYYNELFQGKSKH